MTDMKEEILKVAAEKMQNVGIRSLSIDDICRLLGISKKTFYVYFETKESLVEEMLRRQEQMMTAKVMKSAAGKARTVSKTSCPSTALSPAKPWKKSKPNLPAWATAISNWQ